MGRTQTALLKASGLEGEERPERRVREVPRLNGFRKKVPLRRLLLWERARNRAQVKEAVSLWR